MSTINRQPHQDRFLPPTSDRLKLRYVWGGLATYLPGESFGPRISVDYELVWIITGSAIYHHDGQALTLSSGSLLLTRPGFRETYAWDPGQRTRHAYVHFTPTVLPADWGLPQTWPLLRALPASVAMSGLFHHLLFQWAARSRQRRGMPPRWVHVLLETMLDLFFQPVPVVPQPHAHLPQPLRRALAWSEATLIESPHAVIKLPDLAKAASVSSKHLCRLFVKHLHLSPMQAVRRLRLEQAMGYLERSNLSMKQIADRCGFASPYHFSRVFRQVYGSPPSTVRRELMLGSPPPQAPVTLGGWQAHDWGV